jgi:hypothetical protein
MLKLWMLWVFASICTTVSFSQGSPTWEFGTFTDRMNDKQFGLWGLRATDTGTLSVEAHLCTSSVRVVASFTVST